MSLLKRLKEVSFYLSQINQDNLKNWESHFYNRALNDLETIIAEGEHAKEPEPPKTPTLGKLIGD